MSEERIEQRIGEAIALLQRLIAIPSLSGKEEGTADEIERTLRAEGCDVERVGHNVWCRSRRFDPSRPTLLLNSHHDTVPPAASYTRDPFAPAIEGERLYGLGSNDAGGPLVAMIAAFLLMEEGDDPGYDIILSAVAEEESSGANGVPLLLPGLGPIACGIVGEPTSLMMATAEKGLMVLDCEARGRSGHAARDEGVNAIYTAMADIDWFRNYRFARESAMLGPVRMSVTMIESGTAHNVVPDRCRFVVDVRTTDAYTNRETLDIITAHVDAAVTPRSTHLNPSGIAPDHPLVRAAAALGVATYGSPTLSDQSRMPFPTVKLGPGDSARSHTADEYIGVDEIADGVRMYTALLREVGRVGLG